MSTTQKTKKNNSFYILLLGIIAALVAAYGTIQIINRAVNVVPVVVAATEIQPYTIIHEDQLKVDMLPRAGVKKGMYPNIKSVVGKVSKTQIPAEWPISANALAIDTPGSVLTAQISEEDNPDLRAVPLKLDHIGSLGGKIASGDRVDVVGAMKLPVNGGVQPVCRIVAKNIKVLDLIMGEKNVEGVILAMTPQEYQELQFAQSSGTIALALNPYKTNINAADTTPTTSLDFVTKMLSDITPMTPAEQNNKQGGEQ